PLRRVFLLASVSLPLSELQADNFNTVTQLAFFPVGHSDQLIMMVRGKPGGNLPFSLIPQLFDADGFYASQCSIQGFITSHTEIGCLGAVALKNRIAEFGFSLREVQAGLQHI